MTNDKFLLLKMHPCMDGLSDEIVRRIADACELVKCSQGTILHSTGQIMGEVYLIIHGRIRQSLFDIQGSLISQSQQVAGGQLGALGAALGDPIPLECVAIDPTTLLKIDYSFLLELTKEFDAFRTNFNRLVADNVRSMLLKERFRKKPGLVAIFHESSSTRPITLRLIQRLQELGEQPALFTDATDRPALEEVACFSLKENNQYLSREVLRHKVNTLPDAKRIFVDVDASLEIGLATSIFEASDVVLWCVTDENWSSTIPRLGRIFATASGWQAKTHIVWSLPGDHQWAPASPELRKLASGDFKVSFEQPPPNQNRELLNGFERIIHELRGVRIGLALGGGAARGMAHLGVFKALSESGIIVDRIAGTSAGAMTGIIYASGMEADYSVESFRQDLKPSWIYRRLKNGGYWYLLRKYRGNQFDPMLRKYLKDTCLEQLAIPISSITVDLISGQAVVRDEGDAVNAITESINLPLLSSPINRDGRALVDGGIINNVPADVLMSHGCNMIIAVSVTEQIKHEFASNRPDTPTAKMKKASILETILRTYIVQNVNMNSVGVRPADFVIQPDVSEFDPTEFTRADEMSAIGQASTLAAIPQLRELLSRLDPELFAMP